MDLSMDGADMLDVLRSRYSTGSAALTRKALKMDYITSVRPDGRYTGTVSFGYGSSARFRAIVYDKAWEVFNKRGESLPPTTRFEVTARKDFGAILRDVFMPTALFWHIAFFALLQAPFEGVPVWEPNTDYLYTTTPRLFDSAETFCRRVEFFAELEVLVLLSDSLGFQGREYLKSIICKRVDAAFIVEAESDAV